MFRKHLFVALALIFGIGMTSSSYAIDADVRADAQQTKKTVTGVVLDGADNAAPLMGVNILEKGTTNGAISDIDGKFILKVDANANLEFSFIGYETQLLPVTSSMKVVMEISASNIDEVVVTALGIEREVKSLGYAATKVAGEELAQMNVISPVAALQGKAAGLSIQGSDGGIFGSTKIEIRGVSTLNSQNNQPIFVVDGVMLENEIGDVGDQNWDASSGDFGNMLKNLNSDNYESVNVLKGSAATALYGSRGINGAIVIKTKSGAGATGMGVTLTQSTSVEHVYGQPNFQYKRGPGNYYGNRSYLDDMYGQGFYTTTKDGVDTPTLIGSTNRMFGPDYDGSTMIEDYDGNLVPYAPVDDHFAKMFELGWGSNTNLSIRNGSEKGNFYLSAGYMNRNGTSPNNTFEKLSLFISATRQLSDILEARASISVTQSESGNPPINLGEEIISNLEWNTMYDVDKWNRRDVWQASHGGVPSSSYGDDYSDVPSNDVWFKQEMNSNLRDELVVRPIVRLTADVTDWVKVVAEVNANFYNIQSEKKELGTGYQNEGGDYTLSHSNKITQTGKLSAIFDKKHDDFTHNLLLHGELWGSRKTASSVSTDGGLIVPGQYFMKNSKNTVVASASVSDTKEIRSLLFRYSGSWRDQLYLDITGRNDWSSALAFSDGSGDFSYFYPSVSTSWLFSDTFSDYMPSWVNFGKIRASWAQVGNDTDAYSINKGYTVDNIEHANGNLITNVGSTTSVDRGLKPELKNSIEFGLTLNTLGSRLNLDVAWFSDETTNQIGGISLPSASGISSITTNIGTVTGSGIEVTLTGKPIRTKDLSWTSTFNYWRTVNKVSELNDLVGDMKKLHGEYAYGNYRVGAFAEEGGEYGILYSDSAIAKDDDGNNLLTWHDGVKAPYFKRSGGKVKVGNIRPDFEGSWDNSFEYKNFSLNFLIDMRLGGDVVSYANRYGTAYGVLETSLDAGETADENLKERGVTWSSKYSPNGATYNDGVIPEGVFASGTTVTTPSGTQQDVGGLTWEEAASSGYVDDAVDGGQWGYWHNGWGTGVVNPNWLYSLSYLSLRNISLGYNVQLPKYKIQNLNVNLSVRNAGYLYNSSPNKLNPESGRGTGSAESAFSRSLLPYSRTYTLGLQFTF